MNTSKMKSVLIIVIIFPLQIFAQDKTERENRVDENKIPPAAVKFMQDAFEGNKKIKWYYEVTSGKQSYEAKLKWEGRMNSIEFNTEGIIEDIEKEFGFEELDPEVQQNLTGWFNSKYLNYNIRKIQQQWTGSPDDLEDAVDENELEDITIRYEIEFYGKDEEQKALWEGLFDKQGKFIEKRKVILRPTDNLNF